MITASQLAIIVSSVALVCIAIMVLHLRSEATRKRVAELEHRFEKLSARKGRC